MYVLGFDPGLANFGFAVVAFTRTGLNLDQCGVFTTTPSPKKQRILVSDDSFRRGRQIYQNLAFVVEKYVPVAVCTEGMSFPQNSIAATKLAIAWGALAGVCEGFGLPVVQVSPQAIKKHLCGRNNASKLDVEEAVKKAQPAAGKLLAGVPKTRREHAVDAFAAVLSGLDSEVIKLARKMQ